MVRGRITGARIVSGYLYNSERENDVGTTHASRSGRRNYLGLRLLVVLPLTLKSRDFISASGRENPSALSPRFRSSRMARNRRPFS